MARFIPTLEQVREVRNRLPHAHPDRVCGRFYEVPVALRQFVYDPRDRYHTDSGRCIDTYGAIRFELTREEDEWGRPYYRWVHDGPVIV